jgi:predicted GH43/DUF377 family glycosyl hydrolase/nucleotide-binding universal stress UspA family protein
MVDELGRRYYPTKTFRAAHIEPLGGIGMADQESESTLHDVSRSVEKLLELRRLGIVMAPDPSWPEEAWGVLNPASARSRDGELYLFPRVVAEGNHSRIAIARVIFDASGHPTGVERLGFALEPRESYECGGDGLGGVEDPRITYLPLLDTYVLTYAALGSQGPRIGLAVSNDLHAWNRLGLLYFQPLDGVDFNRCDNKDCVIFPVPVRDPTGRPAFAVLHRPTYQTVTMDGSTRWLLPLDVSDRRQSMWISYAPLDRVIKNIQELTHLSNHQLLAQPLGSWENHHIGAGAPPLLTEEGWLLYYHGVLGSSPPGVRLPHDVMVYQSGIMLLDGGDPRRVYFRSSRPLLVPQLDSERHGVVPNVVFPTAVDVRGRRIDVYYGAADLCIGAATTEIATPVLLAPSAPPSAPPDFRRQRTKPAGDRPGARGLNRDRGDQGEASMQVKSDRAHGFQRILVALDGSKFAERVLPSIETLAQEFGSTVTLIQAVTPIEEPIPTEVEQGVVSEDWQMSKAGPITDEMRAHAESYLTGMRKALEARGLTVETDCPEGEASEAILRRARQLGADLIAITTHGRTGVDRMLFGSVAEEVLRRAPCPVLLIRVTDGP